MSTKPSLDATTLARWRQDIVFKDNVLGDDYTFHSTWGIFSPESIDEGSRLLLEHVDFKTTDNCLDVGCGYGILGMVCAKKPPQGTSVLLDKALLPWITLVKIALSTNSTYRNYLEQWFHLFVFVQDFSITITHASNRAVAKPPSITDSSLGSAVQFHTSDKPFADRYDG